MLSDKRLLEAYKRYDATVDALARSFQRGETNVRARKHLTRLFCVIKRTLLKIGYSEDEITSYENSSRAAFVYHRKKLETMARF